MTAAAHTRILSSLLLRPQRRAALFLRRAGAEGGVSRRPDAGEQMAGIRAGAYQNRVRTTRGAVWTAMSECLLLSAMGERRPLL